MLILFTRNRKKARSGFFLVLWGIVESTPTSLHKLLSIFGNGKKKLEILLVFSIKFLCLKL
jgi:hypothetical protein